MFGEKLKRLFSKKKSRQSKNKKSRKTSKTDARTDDETVYKTNCPPSRLQEASNHVTAPHDDKICGSFIPFQSSVTGPETDECDQKDSVRNKTKQLRRNKPQQKVGLNKASSVNTINSKKNTVVEFHGTQKKPSVKQVKSPCKKKKRIPSAISSKSIARDTGEERNSPQSYRKRQHFGREVCPEDFIREELMSCRDVRWAHENKRTWSDVRGTSHVATDETARQQPSNINNTSVNTSFSHQTEEHLHTGLFDMKEIEETRRRLGLRLSARYRTDTNIKSCSETNKADDTKNQEMHTKVSLRTQSEPLSPNQQNASDKTQTNKQKVRRRTKIHIPNEKITNYPSKEHISGRADVMPLMETMETPDIQGMVYLKPLMVSTVRSSSESSDSASDETSSTDYETDDEERETDEMSDKLEPSSDTNIRSSKKTMTNVLGPTGFTPSTDLCFMPNQLTEEMEKLMMEIEFPEQAVIEEERENISALSNSFINEVDKLLDEAERF